MSICDLSPFFLAHDVQQDANGATKHILLNLHTIDCICQTIHEENFDIFLNVSPSKALIFFLFFASFVFFPENNFDVSEYFEDMFAITINYLMHQQN